MKLAELKNRLKSKYTVRIIAGVLTITLVARGVGVYSVSAAKNDGNTGKATEDIREENSTINIDDMLGNISVSENAVNKEAGNKNLRVIIAGHGSTNAAQHRIIGFMVIVIVFVKIAQQVLGRFVTQQIFYCLFDG